MNYKKNKFLSSKLYYNREFSWLKFNKRVLKESTNKSLPPLEKLKFISIYGSNLDEFYMIRVAGLKYLLKSNINKTSIDKCSTLEQLETIHKMVYKEQKLVEIYFRKIKEELKKNSLFILNYSELPIYCKEVINNQFINQIYPIITPIAIDRMHPFPHLNNLSFAIVLKLKNDKNDIKYALIRIPKILPNFLTIDGYYVPIETVINEFIDKLFKGFHKISSTSFRVTRNAVLDIEEIDDNDFVEILEKGLKDRNRGDLIRLEIMENTDNDLLNLITKHLKFETYDIYKSSIPLNLNRFWDIIQDKNYSHLLTNQYTPKTIYPLLEKNIFEIIKKNDLILHHPYESFEPIVKFIENASKDDNTLAIRMTIYRIGKNSPILESLIHAAKNGKQVTIIFELKARFDEENNLSLARKLEDAGAHVIYGIKDLKVHAKISQVIKSEGDKLQSYLHIGTGNYNTMTSKVYSDISFFTSDTGFNKDATKFFHFLTGFSEQPNLDNFLIAPSGLKTKFIKMIENESRFKKDGLIVLKCNSLVDVDIIEALYKASRSGCQIRLIIRGICTLRPRLKNISENIKVYSIIGKYLEHSRIYYFAHQKNPYYISSADLMSRNLSRRVEIMIPIKDIKLMNRLKNILFLQLIKNNNRWELNSENIYIKDDSLINIQDILELNFNKKSKKNIF